MTPILLLSIVFGYFLLLLGIVWAATDRRWWLVGAMAGLLTRRGFQVIEERDASRTRMDAAIRRGLAWLLAMQNDDGGWGALDHNNDRQFLCHIPFADHNAMIDPSSPDLAARAREALGKTATTPNARPASVSRRSALSSRNCSRYSARDVNIRYGSETPRVMRSSTSTPR